MSNVHPSQLVTPPQAGERHTTPENIRKFFDPTTYKGRVLKEVPTTKHVDFERHTTPENIAKFFDPITYQKKHQGCLCPCQKRPSSEASSVPTVAKAAKTMGATELVETFQLAASLNGLSWNDLAVPKCHH